MTSPEQSNAEGPIAPWRHGSPSCCFAIRMICWDSAVGWAAETVVAGASDRMTAPARATGMIVRAPKDRLRNVLLPTNASLGGDGDVGEARTARVTGVDGGRWGPAGSMDRRDARAQDDSGSRANGALRVVGSLASAWG